MNTFLVVAAFAAGSLACSLRACDEPPNSIMEDTPLDGWAPYQYSVTEERLAESSDWNPLKDKENPVPDKKAVQLALTSLGKYVEDISRYELSGLELKSDAVIIKDGEDAVDRWYWVVSFRNLAVGAIGGVPLTTRIVVLLDGWTPTLRKLEGEEAELVKGDIKKSHQAGTDQPTPATDSKSEDDDKPQPTSEGRSR